MQAMLSNALPYIQEVAREKERAKKSLALKFKSETLSGVQKLCEEYGEVENIEMFPGHVSTELLVIPHLINTLAISRWLKHALNIFFPIVLLLVSSINKQKFCDGNVKLKYIA